MLPKKFFLLNTLMAGLMFVGSVKALEPKLPRPLADVSVDTPGAKRIRVNQTKGSAQVIAILGSTCSHCLTLMETLNKLERQYRARGVKFVGALVDEEGAQQLPNFIGRTNASFPIGTLSQDSTRRLADFGMSDHPFVPILLFVDAGNTVRFQFSGDQVIFTSNTEVTIKNLIEVLLKKK